MQLCGGREVDRWQVFHVTEVQGKKWPNPKNIVLMVEKENRKHHITRNTFSGNTIRKLINGPTWVAEGQRKVIVDKRNNTETWKAVKGFWMAAPRTTAEVAVES